MSRFDEIIERKNTNSLKWDCLKERLGKSDILPMWVADMDFASPPEVISAIVNRAQHRVYGYTVVSRELNEAIISWNSRRNNWELQYEWIVHSPGVVTSIITAILAFTNENDKILVQTPVYYPFFSAIQGNNRKLIKNSLVNNNGYYEIDFEDLAKKLSDGVKMMILCSPQNPIGRVWKKEELSKIAKLCLENNVMIVSDEIHSDLVFEGYKHLPIANFSEEIRNITITLISPTKTFNLAGLAESIAIIPNEILREKFRKTIHNTGADMLNAFGLLGSHAAYAYGENWLNELMSYLAENLSVLNDYIDSNIPQIKVIQPESTYLAWLDCHNLYNYTDNLKDFFVNNAGVGLNDGMIFGMEGKGYQRINFACPRKILIDGLTLIAEAVNRISK